ncbi:MAG: acyloxyacyl hydrolase [Planctomycetes bacterium]|nr:acyloxyacyl hydrolase [Planctomycetota bacterium]
MRAVWATALSVLVAGCQMVGTETHYGVSDNDMSFGEVNVVLAGDDESTVQGVPFLVVGQGTLPEQYGNDISYQRVSLGEKVRLPLRVAGGSVIFYVEAGGMVSYYESEAIGEPFEPEIVAGAGAQIDLGKKWSLDVGARARRPMGNGDDHEEPEHAPDGTQPEFFFGVRKDF